MELNLQNTENQKISQTNSSQTYRSLLEGIVEACDSKGFLSVRAGNSVIQISIAENPSINIGDKVKLLVSLLQNGEIFFDIDKNSIQNSNVSATIITKSNNTLSKNREGEEKLSINSVRLLLSNIETFIDKFTVENSNKVTDSNTKTIDEFKSVIKHHLYQNEIPDELITISNKTLAIKQLPPEAKELIVKLVNLVTPESKTSIVTKQPILINLPSDFKFINKIDELSPLTGEVTDLRPDGRVMISIEKSAPFPVSIPLSVSIGDSLVLLPTQNSNKSLAVIALKQNSVQRGENQTKATIQEVVSNVLKELKLEDNTINIPKGELKYIERIVASISKELNLNFEESKIVARTLLVFSETPSLRDKPKVELAQYPLLKNFGPNSLKLVSLLEEVEQTIPFGESKQFKEILTFLKEFSQPIIKDDEAIIRIVNSLKRLEKESGYEFEQKLSSILLKGSETKKETISLRNDLKGKLIELVDFIEKSGLLKERKEEIRYFAERLIDKIESAQIKNFVDQDFRNMIIPVLQDREPVSAQLSFKRKGKRGPIDSENSTVSIRVSPSQIGEMETIASAKGGRLSIKFKVQFDSSVKYFEEEKVALFERLSALGYRVGTIETQIWNRNHDKILESGNLNSNYGFDITI